MTARLPVGEAPDVRRHNLSQLLRLLHLGGPMRRAQLTGLTGLNRSTVAGLVAELASLGAVLEEPVEGRKGKAGRPSAVVRTRPETVQVLAADVSVGRVSMALIGLGGTIVARRSRQFSDPSARTVARLLASLGRELLGSPRAGRHVLSLGVSVPGVVRGQDGNVRFAPNLGWQDQPLGELLAEALAERGIDGLRTGLANDGDLGALAEHQRGVARGYDDVVFVEGETGVGCGVITGGRSLAGSGGYAGELGHITIRRGGRLCRCGARGCWETEIGAGAMARALGLPEDSDESEVGLLLRSGSPALSARLDDVAEYLGIGLANVVNVFNPRIVVLGGLLQDLYPLVAARVTEVIGTTALRAPMEQVRLVLPELGSDAVLLGAAEYAWQDVLADPVAALQPAS
ncbi:ROK family protein [Kineosporia sp. J2-2]|uniref:ROK family protein n=1 Tax=Kineosporia corallincola TaxID=2835133 RepID=A0ABS5TDS8_9ACTN|nr:ROK family protein [Kineosporia corallincola]MBT0769191.1 ROK family protein [Kineosporia corallincola]